MLHEETAKNLLITIQKYDAVITALGPFIDTDELSVQLGDAVEDMTATRTIMGTEGWRAKLTATALFFSHCHCDVEGRLPETENLFDRLLYSLLRDSQPDFLRDRLPAAQPPELRHAHR